MFPLASSIFGLWRLFRVSFLCSNDILNTSSYFSGLASVVFHKISCASKKIRILLLQLAVDSNSAASTRCSEKEYSLSSQELLVSPAVAALAAN